MTALLTPYNPLLNLELTRNRVIPERIMVFSPKAVFPRVKAMLRRESVKNPLAMTIIGTQKETIPMAVK